jgi:adenylylsulfate kinase
MNALEKSRGFTLWFTGLSGAGKSTNSYNVYMELKRRDLKVELLDGDIIRINFSRELGFSKRDRDINIRRIGFVSYLLNKNDIITIAAAISPYKETRDLNRRLIENYIEVLCDCPLEVLEKRDPKGLYKKARVGEIQNFTGISDPYEPPEKPELVLRTGEETVSDSFGRVMGYLEARKLVPLRSECRYCDWSNEDEIEARQHLVALGFASEVTDL